MKELTFEEFKSVITASFNEKELDFDYLYECYKDAISPSEQLTKANKIFDIDSPNIFVLYLVGEYIYYLNNNDISKINELKKNENFKTRLISNSLDKYLTNEHLGYKPNSFVNKYSPIISSLELYLNFILSMLYRNEKGDPKTTLFRDLLDKAFLLSKSILDLLEDGFETVAFSTWRTLHETECIIALIDKYQDKIISSYLRHMEYNAAFRGLISNKEAVDNIFLEIKSKMKDLDLKSKDMKKFIEYGYISVLPEYKELDLKLNFRDGVEKLSGLSVYNSTYEMSSEIAHSSPIMVYSRKDYFFYLTLLNVYEVFFRLEKYFYTFFKNKFSPQIVTTYEMMRRQYLPQLGSIYEIESKIFNKIK